MKLNLRNINMFLALAVSVLSIRLAVTLPDIATQARITLASFLIGSALFVWIWAEIWMPVCFSFWKKYKKFDLLTSKKEVIQPFLRLVTFLFEILLLIALLNFKL